MLSNQDTEFTNKIIKRVYEIMRTRKLFTSSYNLKIFPREATKKFLYELIYGRSHNSISTNEEENLILENNQLTERLNLLRNVQQKVDIDNSLQHRTNLESIIQTLAMNIGNMWEYNGNQIKIRVQRVFLRRIQYLECNRSIQYEKTMRIDSIFEYLELGIPTVMKCLNLWALNTLHSI
ncbi:hypothetical protein V1477_002792 [Vespula maculifrons]|uniref:Uncharacterized protein n=1 Tax=Vespula maculifrons TaxID=7453 RepID=A0ABD2CVT1_VESMC